MLYKVLTETQITNFTVPLSPKYTLPFLSLGGCGGLHICKASETWVSHCLSGNLVFWEKEPCQNVLVDWKIQLQVRYLEIYLRISMGGGGAEGKLYGRWTCNVRMRFNNFRLCVRIKNTFRKLRRYLSNHVT